MGINTDFGNEDRGSVVFRKAGGENSCLGLSFQQGLFKERSSLYPYNLCVKRIGVEMVTDLDGNITKWLRMNTLLQIGL